MAIHRINPAGAPINAPSGTTAPVETVMRPTPTEPKSAPQPSRKLPTDRVAFNKQLDIMRAYGLASQGGTKAVHYSTAAEMVQMAPNSVSLMNTFLVDSGFVQKSGNDFIPDRALIEFGQAHSWNPDGAPRKLAPLLRRTWFGERMVMKLRFRSMSTEDMLADLAVQIGAGKEFESQITTLVDFAVVGGIVRRDGAQLSLGDLATDNEPGPAPSPPPQENAAMPTPEPRNEPPAVKAGAVATGFMSTEGGIQFHVAIKVDMAEMAGWSPDRISAFFSGVAQVLAAKKGTETI
jgi:hypothetical protein